MSDEKIMITRDSLELALLTKYNHIKRIHNWLTPLGIFLTLFLSSILSDYKNTFYLSSDTWKGIIWFACLLSFIWLVVSWLKNRKTPSVNEIIEAIINRSMKSDYTSIFIITHSFDDGITRFLVTKNKIWNSYFLPHSYYLPTLSIHEQLKNMSIILLSSLGLKMGNADTFLDYIGSDLDSIKFSMKHKEHKQFNFKFFKMRKLEVNHLIESSNNALDFVVDGTQYHWKSINEISSDEGTMKHNEDIIIHIKRNLVVFQ
ncbi:MAG: hypothetical protein GY797_40825 [Deltaproteobacteria bacterium]|nr:hypothetical protein [Deltaproteobacteria bacterium]